MNRFVALTFVLIAGVFAPVYADYMDFHFELKCDPLNNRAEVVPYAVWNSTVYSAAPQDCALSNGRTVRAKMGLGPTYPYGMGGADPEKWFSVWVDQALVLSRERLGCEDEGPCSVRAIVTAKGFEVCRRGTSAPTSQPNEAPKPQENCSFIPNEKLVKTRDALEYPSAQEKVRPAAGSLATLFAKDKNFCSQFKQLSQPRGRSIDNLWSNVAPAGSEIIDVDASSPYEYAGGYVRYELDINNDGKIETVVALHSRTHYRDGDIYFVYPTKDVPTPTVERVGSTRSEIAYAKGAARILPHYWSDFKGADEKLLAEMNRDDGAYQVKAATAPWWDSDDQPIFRFRYWYLWPFRYKETTYFLTGSQEAAKKHWYVVLRPEPDFKVTEMCVFQIVRPRY